MVTFIVHGGYGKTATSFLQQIVFSHLDDVLYFGKLKDDKMLPDELGRLYYEIFPPFSRTVLPMRARNSSLLIPQLGDLLIKEMKKASKKIVLLSNECLIDYANYNAELNMLLLYRLFNYLQDNYDEGIEFKMMMTIRNQKEFLKSYYAYDFSVLKERFSTLQKFIQYGIANNHEIVFGGCHYDLVWEDMEKIFGKKNVQFFIYERMKKDIHSYLNNIFEFIGTSQTMDTLDYDRKINVNFDGRVHRMRDVEYGFWASFMMKFYQHNKERLNFLTSLKGYHSFKNIVLSYCNNSMRVVDAGGLYDLPKDLVQRIDKIYKASNQNLARKLDSDLETYGYIGGQK